MRDPRYDILFEPVPIGPVTAPNRFYQVPHCNVLGHGRPRAEAENRRMKAEGGWGVICTQEVEIHPSAELYPSLEGRIWDERDIPQHRLMTDAVHAQGALAGDGGLKAVYEVYVGGFQVARADLDVDERGKIERHAGVALLQVERSLLQAAQDRLEVGDRLVAVQRAAELDLGLLGRCRRRVGRGRGP